MFIKYQHIERWGSARCYGINNGHCFVFPKLDGTNASVWSEDGVIKCGSRNRELSADSDNAGFYKYVQQNEPIAKFLEAYSDVKLYGEWLVPHTLKTYRDDCWRKFYVFDVYDKDQKPISYNNYSPILASCGIDYIAPLCHIENPSLEDLLKVVQNNTYLIQDGKGQGEGVVVKNYDYTNKFGRTIWAKIVTNEFKDKHSSSKAIKRNAVTTIEDDFVHKYVDKHLVEKTHAKIVNDVGEWSSKLIPRLFQTVYYDLVREDIWAVAKKHNIVDFGLVKNRTISKVKELMPELF